MTVQPRPYAGYRFVALAHRGGSLLPGNEGQENTLAAFARASQLGYTCLETDVRLTRDGVLVLFHDDTTDRLAGVPGTIEARTWAEVAELRVGGQPVPLLDDLFEAFPDHRFNIDLKGPGTADPLLTAIARHRAYDRVLVASFSHRRLAAFRRLSRGNVATGAARPGILWSRYLPALPHRLHSPGQAFQIPVKGRVGPLLLTGWHPRLVANAHAAGQAVHVWTIDDAATMNRLIDLGVDGIITDRPDILREVLLSRDLWEGT